MPFSRVRFLNAGYCSQWGTLAGRASGGWTRFYGVFVHLEHPVHGVGLIDTGYGPDFYQATRRFPARLHRWATPAHLAPEGEAWSVLEARGLRPDDVGEIFVSHFHADHIAGLHHFPRARFVYRPDSFEALCRMRAWDQVHNGFLIGLVPEDLRERGRELAVGAFSAGAGDLEGFRVLDYWGDGDLLIVDLPGHALGHTGYVIRTEAERIFYVVDACWDMDGMLQGRRLPWLSRRVHHSSRDYDRTQEKLRGLAARGGWNLLACHCPRTQEYVARPED
jgi:glyoxylase-like metal-dependent hydrolase (beta-lactamase superfamily II)